MNTATDGFDFHQQRFSTSIMLWLESWLQLALAFQEIFTLLLAEDAELQDDDDCFPTLWQRISNCKATVWRCYALATSNNELLFNEIPACQCFPGSGALSGYHSTTSRHSLYRDERTRVDALMQQPNNAWCVLNTDVDDFERLFALG